MLTLREKHRHQEEVATLKLELKKSKNQLAVANHKNRQLDVRLVALRKKFDASILKNEKRKEAVKQIRIAIKGLS